MIVLLWPRIELVIRRGRLIFVQNSHLDDVLCSRIKTLVYRIKIGLSGLSPYRLFRKVKHPIGLSPEKD